MTVASILNYQDLTSAEYDGWLIEPKIGLDETFYAVFKKVSSWQSGVTRDCESEDEAKEVAREMIDGYDASIAPFVPEQHGGYQPIWDLSEKIRAGELSVGQYLGEYQFWRGHKEPFIAELCKRFDAKKMQTIATNCGSYHANRSKKAENAQYIYGALLRRAFHLGPMFSHGMEGPEAALDRYVSQATPERFTHHVEKAQKDAAETGRVISNPQTLQDFSTCCRHFGGYQKMPEEFRAKYDTLVSADRREREKTRSNSVSGFSGGEQATGELTIVEGFHQKRQCPTFTVRTENFLNEKFTEALSLAKTLGGNYVNAPIARMYRATAGFQFFSREIAQQFVKGMAGEAVDVGEKNVEREIERIESATERLMALADNLEQKAQEELERPRQTNTVRRAEIAAGMQNHARAEAAKAKTIRRIAEGLANNTIVELKGIRRKSHVESLDWALADTKYRRWQKTGKDGERYEEMKARPASADDIAAAAYPYPRIWEDDLRGHLSAFENEPGLKILAKDLRRRMEKSVYKKKLNSIDVCRGMMVHANQLLDHPGAKKSLGDDRAVRVHVSEDPKLLKGRATEAFTADGGKTWGVSLDIAISAALLGKHLDVIEAPKHEMIEFSDPSAIGRLQTAIKKLRRHRKPALKRVAEALGATMEEYSRMQAMDIKSTAELRAALREYAPLKAARDEEDPVQAMERALIGCKIDGFFPTPRTIINLMLAAADIEPGMSVLEPSAGKGDIMDAIRELHPDAQLVGIEPVYSLRQICDAKNHVLHDDRDFLKHCEEYDRIVMNPPFENRQDILHVMRAYDCLKSGGRMVAIVSAGIFARQSSADQSFRDWLESIGAEIEMLPEGAFNTSEAFRKTGVSTRMVVITKE